MASIIVKYKNRQFNRFKNHKNALKRLNHHHVIQFNKLYQNPNCIDKVIGCWQIVVIHQMPSPFKIGDEMDFWCCDGERLILLKIRHQSYQQFTIIHPDVIKQTPAYWIAQLPMVQSPRIDDEFLLKILKHFDKNLDNL